MAKEKLKEIIGAVDTKKMLEASYTLSPSKFNGVASTYTKFVYLMALLNLKSDESEKVSVAESTIGKIKNDVDCYSYDAILKKEKAELENATKMYDGVIEAQRKNVAIHDAAKNLVKKHYISMISTLEYAYENYPEWLIEYIVSDMSPKEFVETTRLREG